MSAQSAKKLQNLRARSQIWHSGARTCEASICLENIRTSTQMLLLSKDKRIPSLILLFFKPICLG